MIAWQLLCAVSALALTQVTKSASESLSELPPPNDKLNIYALPVGQGDCTIIQCPRTPERDANGKKIPDEERWKGDLTIVDMGSLNSDGYMGREQIREFLGTQVVDYLFLSHPDRDHVNFVDAIEREGVQTLVTTKIYHACDASQYDKFGTKQTKKWLKNHRDTAKNINRMEEIKRCVGTSIRVDDIPLCTQQIDKPIKLCERPPPKKKPKPAPPSKEVVMNVLASGLVGCPTETRKSNNGDSLVLQLVTPAGFKVLLPGDFEDKNPVEAKASEPINLLMKAFLPDDSHKELKSDVYRLAHHGAYGSANKYHFLEAIHPRFAFSSSTLPPGKHGHPICHIYNILRDIMPTKSENRRQNAADDDGQDTGNIRQSAEEHAYSCAWNKASKRKDYKVGIDLYSTAPSKNVHHVIHFEYDIENEHITQEHETSATTAAVTVKQWSYTPPT